MSHHQLHKHSPPPHLTSLLLTAANPTTVSAEVSSDATETALQWLLSPELIPPPSASTSTSTAASTAAVPHWYCGKDGYEGCWETAVFCIRLFAFKPNERITRWRELLDQILMTCPSCVLAFQRAKIQFQDKYLKITKSSKSIATFFEGVSKIEVLAVAQTFESYHLSISTGTDQDSRNVPPASVDLSQVPITAIYRLLVDPNLFQQEHLIYALQSGLPLTQPLPLPPTVSPGLLALALHQSPLLSEWAISQLALCESASSDEYTANQLSTVIDAHLFVLTKRDSDEPSLPTSILVDYTLQRRSFWKGLAACLKALSPDLMRAHLIKGGTYDIVRIVASHLSDTEDHLEFVLAAFEILLKSLREHFWATGEDRFEEVVLHHILDNPSFETALRGIASATSDQPFLTWLPPFVTSVRKSSERFVNSLAVIASTFLDRFQNVRFDPIPRTVAIQVALKIFTDVFRDPATSITIDDSTSSHTFYPHASDAAKVLDLHARFITEIAFSKTYSFAPWIQACDTASLFVGQIMTRDAKRVVDNVLRLAKYREAVVAAEKERDRERRKSTSAKAAPSKDSKALLLPGLAPPLLSIAKTIWEYAYGWLEVVNVRGLGVVLRAVTLFSHVEKLARQAWYLPNKEDDAGRPVKPEIDPTFLRPWMKTTNEAMDLIRSPFTPLILSLADDRTDILLDFLGRHGTGECIAAMLLSPVDEIYNMALSVVKQAFDVTDRRESLRSLLFQLPDATLRGLSLGIKQFVATAKALPEATGMAKRLVRCLTDVISVLCTPRDGLLRDQGFLSKSNDLRKRLLGLWKIMCQALALLFKQTPAWSDFFETLQMTEWMRDAILFGADMLDEVWTFDLIISGQGLQNSAASPTKLSNNGYTMVDALNEPLEELMAWLRLSDPDLLLSSFDLVVKMLNRFTRSGITIRQATVDKIRRMTEKALQRADLAPQGSSRLSHSQLRELLALVSDEPPPSPKLSASKSKSKSSQGIEVIQIDDDDEPSRPSSSKPTRPSSSIPAKPFSRQPVPSSSLSSRPSFPSSQLKTAAKPSPKFGVPIMKSVTAPRPKGQPWTIHSSKPDKGTSDSSSDEESDEDGEKSGLAGLVKAQKAPTIKQTERRTTKLYDPNAARGGALSARLISEQAQAARAARLRGVQDFSNLHRRVLQWEITHDGALPPDMTQNPRGVPSEFETPEEYFQAFEPLLLVEFWEQVRQAKQEASIRSDSNIQVDVAGRQAVDDFTDIFITIDHSKTPDKIWFSESDLLILKQEKKQTLAKVQACVRRKDFFEITLRCHLGKDNSGVGAALMPKTRWTVVQLLPMSTMYREYAALVSIQYLDLCNDILRPKAPPRPEPSASKVDRAMKAYNVNEPQAKAILASLQSHGFSLIQGPPGTGKTKTILGLIGAFIDGRPPVATPIIAGKAASRPAAVSKVLLCAPSNAAVDEVVKRLKHGVQLSNGRRLVPKIVRIGAPVAIDASVKDVFLDDLVEVALGKTKDDGKEAPVDMVALRAEVDGLRGDRDAKRVELDRMDNNDERKAELVVEFKKIKARIHDLSQKMDSERDKAQQTRRALDAEQRKMRLEILSDADVICSTLSGAGHDYLSHLPFDFESVIIDEAAQSIELASLIPLKYGSKRCILVGDPLQLPPTVLSSNASRVGYDRSLFVRMMEQDPRCVHLLSIQYRMHSQISSFPSTAFYDSQLTDGPDMDDKTKQPWHASPLFPPYAFMHVKNGTEVQDNRSWKNSTEASTSVAMFDRLRRDFPSINFDYRIGIVTPYKAQVAELRRQFRTRFGEDIVSRVSFNTVDGFQGQEKDIIILSCVRGGADDKGVGFLADTRRMNVALTRARSSLLVLGDQRKLQTNPHWKKLVFDAQKRGFLTEVDSATFRSSAASIAPLVRPTATASRGHASAIAIPMTLYTPRQLSELSQAKKGTVSTAKRKEELPQRPDEAKKARIDSPPVPNVPPSSVVPMGPIPPPSAEAPPPKRILIPKKPVSLFVPKKRPLPNGGAPGPVAKK